MKLRPIGNRVLVKPFEKKETINGVYIPDSVKDRPTHFIIQDIGQGWTNDKGENIPIKNVKIGDHILLEKHAGLQIKNDEGQIKRIVNANEILAVFQN